MRKKGRLWLITGLDAGGAGSTRRNSSPAWSRLGGSRHCPGDTALPDCVATYSAPSFAGGGRAGSGRISVGCNSGSDPFVFRDRDSTSGSELGQYAFRSAALSIERSTSGPGSWNSPNYNIAGAASRLPQANSNPFLVNNAEFRGDG